MKELEKSCEKAIRTTMIGSLDIIEQNLGYLWAHNGIPSDEQEKHFKNIYMKIRSEILGNGNDQIRDLESEFENYNVERKVTSINMPILKDKENE